MERNHDLKETLSQLQWISYESHLDKTPVLSGVETLVKLCNCKQDEGQKLASYFREFKAQKEVNEEMGGLPGMRPGGVLFPRIEERFVKDSCNSRPILDKDLPEWNNDVMWWGSEYSMAVLAMKNSCDARCRELKSYLQKEHVLWLDKHPTSLSEVFKLLNNHVRPKTQAPKVSVFRKTIPNTDNEEQELGFF